MILNYPNLNYDIINNFFIIAIESPTYTSPSHLKTPKVVLNFIIIKIYYHLSKTF